jgi:hypothetical protein
LPECPPGRITYMREAATVAKCQACPGTFLKVDLKDGRCGECIKAGRTPEHPRVN